VRAAETMTMSLMTCPEVFRRARTSSIPFAPGQGKTARAIGLMTFAYALASAILRCRKAGELRSAA
jgi:hypothetical protein